MNTYTITHVSDEVRAWNTKAGAPWKSYRVALKNAEGREKQNVEISRNASAPAPKVGETVEGTVDTSGQYGPKLQEARKGGGGGRAKPPEERRSIAMQSSLARGVDLVRLAVEADVWKPETTAELEETALAMADKFYERVQKAEAGT